MMFSAVCVLLIADAKTLLAEESAKEPCKRFLRNGECVFGSNCRFTHFSHQQLQDLKHQSE
jgi:U11/U12 small nuclear ribonucleoprotein SNRNP20